jgi:hypothetical protein
MAEASWNVSTPPITSPAALRSGATLTSIGIRSPRLLCAKTNSEPLLPVPVMIDRCKGQYSWPHNWWPSLSMWHRMLSKHGRPITSRAVQPVIRSADLLQYVIRRSRSQTYSPSLKESTIAWTSISFAVSMLVFLFESLILS